MRGAGLSAAHRRVVQAAPAEGRPTRKDATVGTGNIESDNNTEFPIGSKAEICRK